MGPVGTGDWGLGLGLDNKSQLDLLLSSCFVLCIGFICHLFLPSLNSFLLFVFQAPFRVAHSDTNRKMPVRTADSAVQCCDGDGVDHGT